MTALDTITILSPRPPSISVQGDDGSELLRIDPDGTITFSSLIEAQEAGRIFVDTVRQYLKPMADLVAEVEALKAENERLLKETNKLRLRSLTQLSEAYGGYEELQRIEEVEP